MSLVCVCGGGVSLPPESAPKPLRLSPALRSQRGPRLQPPLLPQLLLQLPSRLALPSALFSGPRITER